MKPIELVPGIFHLRGGSNMGLVVHEGKGLLIDAGLDKDAARRAQRIIESLEISLEAVFLTHAHADHFGGAHFLQRRLAVPLYAPSLEAAMMENPIIEPLYLYGGAAPIGELRHKFILARACQIDHVVEEAETTPIPLQIGDFHVEIVSLPGHAPNQVGVAVNNVLFCADAIFPQETLQKHKLTFCFDLDKTLVSIEKLAQLPYAVFAPGHGPAYATGGEIAQICQANCERLEAVRDHVLAALETPQETPDLVQMIADQFALRLGTAAAFYLTRTTILAALSSLERAGEIRAMVEGNRLLWRQAH